jgi:hypothetical protein
MKIKYDNKVDQKMKDQDKEYKPMLNKFMGIKNDLDSKIGSDLEDMESEFERKKRERRERSISKSIDKGKKKKGDDDPVDTENMLGNIERKKKFESGDLDTPF